MSCHVTAQPRHRIDVSGEGEEQAKQISEELLYSTRPLSPPSFFRELPENSGRRRRRWRAVWQVERGVLVAQLALALAFGHRGDTAIIYHTHISFNPAQPNAQRIRYFRTYSTSSLFREKGSGIFQPTRSSTDPTPRDVIGKMGKKNMEPTEKRRSLAKQRK
jgi:hypothetical protein